jgi:transcriptional regulator with GAF, ATPase, and Fis domain
MSGNSEVKIDRTGWSNGSNGGQARSQPNQINDVKEAGLGSFQLAVQAIKAVEFEIAMKHQFHAVSCLNDFPDDPECRRVLILAALSLSDLFLYVRQRHDEVLKVLQQAEIVTLKIGDKRSRLLINLHRSRIYQIVNRIGKAIDGYTASFKIINELNDEDIRIQCSEFLGFYSLLLGRHKECIDYFEQATKLDNWREGQVFNLLIPIYSGGSAAFLGQFYRGIGLLDSQWRRALVSLNYQAARLLRAHLSNALLMAGKKKEALVHLQANEAEAEAHEDAWALMWTRRVLAYSYFLAAQFSESYDLLKKSFTHLSDFGIPKQYYGQPWILEMLFEFHKQGFEPIPEYNLEQELEEKVAGPNILLSGIAHRIKAEQAILNNEAPARIEELLRKSEELLKISQSPVELGKTRIVLSRLKLHQGDREEAVELALKARQGLSGFSNTPFPGELQMLIQDKRLPAKDNYSKNEILVRYFEIIEEFVPSPDPDTLFSKLINVTSQLLEAERGAIFLLNRRGKRIPPELYSSFNISREEVQETNFRSHLEQIIRAFRNKKATVSELFPIDQSISGQQTSSILCLPFEIKNKTGGIIYFETSYLKGRFDFLSDDVLKQMSQNMSGYIERIIEYSGQEENKTISRLRDSTAVQYGDENEIISKSATMAELLTRADQAADSHAPVLILGDTGVGKGLLALRIHKEGPRHAMPFIGLNLASLPETLIESELFGHEKGAFTGAERQKLGRIELADKGTLFVDEIGDIPLFVQVKILQALEEKTFFRVGGTQNIKSDFRLIAATNKDLNIEVEKGRFREDLFYRLNVIPLYIPPLRDRKDDILVLAEYFLNQYAEQHKRLTPKLSDDDKAALADYHWPGNVRELKNVIERSIVLAANERLAIALPNSDGKLESIPDPSLRHFTDLPTMEEMQRRYIKYVADQTGGKIGGPGSMADILGMKRTTLQSRMKKLGI